MSKSEVKSKDFWFKIYREDNDRAEFVKYKAESEEEAKTKIKEDLLYKKYIFPVYLSTSKTYPRMCKEIHRYSLMSDRELKHKKDYFKQSNN